jgi:hypothetical protein
MSEAVLWLHFLGLMMGAGGGFGSMLVMRVALTRPPEQQSVLQSLGPVLARLSLAGLALMLATGLALVFLKYRGFAAMGQLFWVKMVFVASLTAAVIAIELTYAAVRKGDAGAARRLPALGPWAGISSLLAVLFAVLAFH